MLPTRSTMNVSSPHLRGPRLSFRDFTPADIPDVHNYTADPLVSQWSIWGPDTLEQTTSSIEYAARAHLNEHRTSYTLADVLEGRAIGSVSIWITDESNRNGELGYTFHRAHWGKGYATEAVDQLLTFGFPTLGLQRIAATCHPENQGSTRVLEKNGFPSKGAFARTASCGEHVAIPCSSRFCLRNITGLSSTEPRREPAGLSGTGEPAPSARQPCRRNVQRSARRPASWPGPYPSWSTHDPRPARP